MVKLFLSFSLAEVLGSDASKLDTDERLKLKVKGTGLTLRVLMQKAADACEESVKARGALDKRGAWLACMSEVFSRAIELLNSGYRLEDAVFDAEIDGSKATLRDAVEPFIEACRATTVKTVDDEWENTKRCAVDAMLVTKLRLQELLG
ncbi:MAG: hypothetical protein QXW41_07565 [Fervidicoccaceae archaeon]